MSASERVAVLSTNPHEQRVSTGFEALDAALGGLFWGDNVVWLLDGPRPSRSSARSPATTSAFVLEDVGLARRATTYRDVAGMAVIEAGPRSPLAQPADLLREIHRAQPGARPPAVPVRLDGRDGAGVGREPHARLLRPLLPDAARVRRDRLLVDDRARDAAGRPGHRPRRDAVRPARRRPQRARGQGRGPRRLRPRHRPALAPGGRAGRPRAGGDRRPGGRLAAARCAARASSASTTSATSRASRPARSRRSSAASAASRSPRSCGSARRWA